MWKRAETAAQKMAVIDGFLPLTASEYLKALIFFCGDDDEAVWKNAVEKLKIQQSSEIKKLISPEIPEKSVLSLTKFAGARRDSSIIILLLNTGKLKIEWLLSYLAFNDQNFWTTLVTHRDFIRFSLPRRDDFAALFASISPVLTDLYREQLSYVLSREEEIPNEKSRQNQSIKETKAIKKGQTSTEERADDHDEGIVELESELIDIPDFLVSNTAFEGLNADDMMEKRKRMVEMVKDMNIEEKIKIAMIGNLEVRKLLIKDPRKQVAMAVLDNAGITDKEIAAIASDAAAPLEIITHIANLKSLSKSYQIKLALINNPKTPVKIALALLETIRINDLKRIAKSRDVPAIVKMRARKKIK